MLLLHLFIKGLLIGFAIAAPVGPIGVLCIHRTLHDGWRLGLASGMGAALADGTYGAIAGFGLTLIANFLLHHIWWIKLIGGFFLIYLGIKTLVTRPPKQLTVARPNRNLFRAMITTFFLTLTSPMTILVYVAIFAGLGLSAQIGYLNTSVMVMGIILGSLSWWLILTTCIAFFFHNQMNETKLYWVNFISGSMIFGFGIAALITLQWR